MEKKVAIKFFDMVVEMNVQTETATHYVLVGRIPGAKRDVRWDVRKDSDQIVHLCNV